MFERCLALRLKSDNDETNENIDHEESDDDDVDEIEDCNHGTEIVLGTNISFIRVNRHIQNTEK